MTSGEDGQLCRVVVHQTRHLVAKGADGTWSSAFVKMTCDKERFMTSVAEKSPNPQWNEDCEFTITRDDACVELWVYHRGKLLDVFLGMVAIPLGRLRNSHAAVTKWYKLQQRPGKSKKDSKDRGEIEITVEIMEDSAEPLAIGVDCDGSEVRGQDSTSKAKRSSSLRAKPPGLKSKLKVPRLKSYTAVSKDDSTCTLPEITGREKSDSNDSGRASDSIASESPASERRLSHNAQGNFGSEESMGSDGSHSKEKKGGLRKRMKSAIGSLKREKAHSKAPSQSPYSSESNLPSPSPEALHEILPPSSLPERYLPSDSQPNHAASTSELYTRVPKAARPLSYPLRSISEEYIPLEVLYSSRGQYQPRQRGGAGKNPGGGGTQEQNDERSSDQSSRDSKLRHSFRSGLPSLRKSNVSVTFDPTKESGYGTSVNREEHEELPAQYVNMTKEGLIRRLLLKERLLRERQQYIRELEDYTDNLLLKVMLESPRLLDRDFHPKIVKPAR
ncbi:rab11 family-interacting protein 2-like [Acanthaster planci]|uniref:Rab11 family-interacting protein 2-like n=1 Tax=Acanthaster planci TaxID=133434 RepID=A0A8B7YNU8_ACAPL|nr:rab11 family-interacting protein 2-like [Acanthaster planci]